MPSRYGLSIRAADPADADAVEALLRAAGLAVAPGLGERLAGLRAEGGAALLAEDWGPASGVIALSWRWTPAAPLRLATIDALAIAPEARRKGVGRLLLKSASQAARAAGCGELRLEVPLGADDLHAFGLAAGFVPTGAALARPLRKRS